ncbi:MAG: hypothetical protein AAF577_02425 [Pseudomonadota bacterium]
MIREAANRGSAKVGVLDDLDAVEARAVRYLRLWCTGPKTQETVWNDFAKRFGGREGAARLRVFEHFVETLIEHARRPMMRHAVDCDCLGADECAFANLIGAAACGDREEAALFATLIVRPDMATVVADRCEQVAMTLRQIVLRRAVTSPSGAAHATHSASHVIH